MLPSCSGIGTRTCVALFLFLLVRCYVSTVVYVTLVHLVLYSSVPVALLDLALDAAVVLHGHGELPLPILPRQRLSSHASVFIACRRCFRAFQFIYIYILTDMDVCLRWCRVVPGLLAAARLRMQGRRSSRDIQPLMRA